MPVLLLSAVDAERRGLPGLSVGVGVVPAGIATARLLASERPSAVVLVGTAGAYAGGPPVGAVVAARRVGLVSGTATLGLGYVPLPPPPVAADPELLRRLSLPEADVACLVAITTDPALATAIGASWQVEHMEAYGVAAACAAAGVAFAVVLGITNVVGPSAHAEWLANREACQDAAAGAVARLVGGR
jgi:purine-nucleoside phosphorylase